MSDLLFSSDPKPWDKLGAKDLSTIVWDAVYNERSLVTGASDAKDLADRVVTYVARGAEITEREHRIVRRAERWKAWRRTWPKLLLATIITAVVGGISGGFYAIWKVDSNDYADVDPGSVGPQATDAIRAYYGLDDLPTNLVQTTERHSHFIGKPAWYARFVGDHNKVVCVYVWSGQNGNYHSPVEQGAICRV